MRPDRPALRHRLDEIERRAARTELFVDRMHERVHLRRLVRADMHQRPSLICAEILRHLADPVRRAPKSEALCRIAAASAMTT